MSLRHEKILTGRLSGKPSQLQWPGRMLFSPFFFYLCTFWILFWGSMQQDVAFVGDVQVYTVCSHVIRHSEFVVAVVTHLLHDL